ncbi:MAG: type I polyketide synthase [Candidatus Promineifilaceae bacterium]
MDKQFIGPNDVAIIGMAGRYPQAPDLATFWHKLVNAEEFTTFYTEEQLREMGVDEELIRNPKYVKAGGYVETVETFDAAFFGYNPREASFMDPQHRHFLETAWEALEDAGYDPARIDFPVGVFGGAAMDTYVLLNIASNPQLMTPVNQLQIQIGNDNSYLTTRVSYKLNLKGPSHTVQSACSTSLVAAHVACQSLLNGECDMALAGGAAVHATDRSGYWHFEGGMSSPDGHCRTFDAQGGGPIFNTGVGVIVLKRLEDALEDHDHIYAIIKGSAINNDGALKVSYAAPSVTGQSEVIVEALANAGVDPETISYVEAHGTATPLGDPIEMTALTRAYRQKTDKVQFCGIGSVKSNLGHLDAAAGVTSLFKAVLSLHHKQIPASLHFHTPNPQIEFDHSPFRVITKLTDWPAGPTPRRAGVSSFGIGGTNAHVILQEAPEPHESSDSRPTQLLLLSAKTASALDRMSHNLAAHLRQHPALNLADVAYTLQVGRQPFNHRRIVLADDASSAIAALESGDPQKVRSAVHPGVTRSVAFMFSGQGAQYPHMAKELYDTEPIFRAVVDECCDLLQPHMQPYMRSHMRSHLGLDLRTVLLSSPSDAEAAAQLQQTWLTQPALFVTEYALAQLWRAWGVEPDALIGHSIGEYVAACLAGVFSLPDALALVARRGQLMQSLPSGAMLTLPLSETAAQPWLNGQLSVAAVNESSRCVVSGPEEAISELERRLAAQGIESRRLHTSHAFHSAMMDPILAEFRAAVSRTSRHAPKIPFISNVSGSWITAAQATNPDYWATHLRQAVRFADGVAELLRDPHRICLEVGPGRTLATLVNRHEAKKDSHVVLASLRHPQDSGSNLAFLLFTLGQLWLAGVNVDWDGFYRDEVRHRVSLPTYPFERQRYWIEPGKHTAVEKIADKSQKQPLGDWFYISSWKRSMPRNHASAPAKMPATTWLLFKDDVGLGDRLAQRLRQHGHTVITVTAGNSFAAHDAHAYTINPEAPADYDQLLQALMDQSATYGGILHLWSVTTSPEGDDKIERAAALQQRGFYSLIYLAQALGRLENETPLTIRVLSNNMQAVANETILEPAKVTLLGPCQVITQEYASLTCQSIDVTLPAAGSWQESRLLDQLLAEFYATPDETNNGRLDTIALRGADRWVRVYEPSPLPNSPTLDQLPLRDGGVYLITGGLGGLGLELTHFIARTVAANLVLLNRTPLPERETWAGWLASSDPALAGMQRRISQIQALEAQGANVLALSADVSDRAQMQQVMETIRARFGRLDGVVHAAGVPGAGIVQLKTAAAAASVLAPKLYGTLILQELLADQSLDFFLLFSSITAITGGFGQVDYCAANAFLDAFAQANSALRGQRTLSINWDAWQQVGMAASPELQQLSGGGPGELPTNHPLLARYRPTSEDGATFTTRFTPAQHWVLGEHRVAGIPTIPGAAYPEVTYAAFRHHTGHTVAEIDDLTFLMPFMVGEDAGRELIVALEPVPGDGGEYMLRAASQTHGGGGTRWQDHVTGRVRPLIAAAAPRLDIPAIIARCQPVDLAAISDRAAAMADFVDIGPRWECIQAVYAGAQEGLAHLRLAEPFLSDLEQYTLHPALLDIATSFAIQSVGEGNYLPLSYQNMRVYAPFTPDLYCFVRLPQNVGDSKEVVAIDVLIANAAGAMLVEINGFAVKRVAAEALNRLVESSAAEAALVVGDQQKSSPVALRDLSQAILPAEGVEAFQRLLAFAWLPQVIVSTRNLAATIAEVNAFDPQSFMARMEAMPRPGRTHKYPRPDLSVPYVAPRSAAEEQIAALWQDVLGLDQVGVHDNFFELGGDSLLGTQIMARAKDAGIELTPNQFFQHQTVAEIAALLQDQISAQPATQMATTAPLPRSIMAEEQLLDNLDQLSEAEIDALLADMMTGK